MIHSAIYTMVR